MPGFAIVEVPGRTEVNLAGSGLNIIVREKEGIIDGDASPTSGEPSDVIVTVRSKANGQVLPLKNVGSVPGKPGTPMVTFDLKAPGVYEVNAAYRDGRAGPRTNLSIVAFLSGLILTMLGSVLVFFLGIGAAIAIIAIVAVKRSQAQNRARFPPPATT